MSITNLTNNLTITELTEGNSPAPSATSSMHDFDFLAGAWNISNKRLTERLSGCTEWISFGAKQVMQIILNGKGNTDIFRATVDEEPFEGMTLRLFNPSTRLWSIYWADSNRAVLDPPVIGSFDGDIGNFYGHIKIDEQPILVKFKWDKTNPVKPIWSQAFSIDHGATWEWNWYMYFSKQSDADA